MANLLDQLQGHLSDDLINQLSQQLGGAGREQTVTAANGVISTLVSQLARNASSPEGASNLANALDRDHDGSVLDNLMDVIGGGATRQAQTGTLNGAGIIKHILGDRQGGVIDMISQMSGLDQGKTGNLLTMLAPVVMGMIGKQKREQGLDVGGLSDLLNGEATQQRQSNNPAMSMITQFLDADKDGSITDDVANMGMRFLGNLFKKR
ncbi:MAG: DUF937 domain-containing protein [Saprospirales bacterium]|jgi:hypothetical protein|nr:DUF937 domain-containing protein [Saprospirales bacterium]MBK7337963.1 DUF937 domain-containing protein [Saprospirales bacterium]